MLKPGLAKNSTPSRMVSTPLSTSPFAIDHLAHRHREHDARAMPAISNHKASTHRKAVATASGLKMQRARVFDALDGHGPGIAVLQNGSVGSRQLLRTYNWFEGVITLVPKAARRVSRVLPLCTIRALALFQPA